MDDILSYLSNYALDHNVGVILTRCLPSTTSSAASKARRMVVVNMNWRNPAEIPFMFGHELGHIMDTGVTCYYRLGKLVPHSSERSADIFSINLLWQYAENHQQAFSSPLQFMRAYGIPDRLLDDVQLLFTPDNDLTL